MHFTNHELNEKELINYEKYPVLNLNGSNDENGFQIFTPECVVNGMLNSIGIDNILDIKKTILEPTSGDGAFTVRILDLRLKYIIEKSKDEFLVNSAIALSTIYSIEMDLELLIKQRNNIFSLIHFYINKFSIPYTVDYFKLIEDIIKTNFIWGETNIRKDHVFKENNKAVIGWYMPSEIEKTKLVYTEKTVETTNLFGEIEYIKVKSKDKKEKKVIESRRSKTNRIKIYQWTINKDLSFTKKAVPIEVD